MWSLLFRRKHWPIGLDIGRHSIKMLQLRKVGQTVCVSACARWEFADGAGADPKQRRRETVNAVREMLRDHRFRGRRVVSALSSEDLNIKNVRLPQMPEDELMSALEQEARARFGYEAATDQLCCLHAGQVRAGNEMRNEIIILEVPAAKVAEHLSLLADAGLRVEHIDAEPVALFRGMGRLLRRRMDEQAVSVVLDVGLLGSRVVVARGRRIVFIKSIDIGGRKLTEAVARQLNLEYTEAAELRARMMHDGAARRSRQGDAACAHDRDSVEWTVHDAVRGEVEALAREVALCLRYCSVTFRGLRPERITVTGGQAYDPALIRLLNEHMNIECVVGEPLKGIEYSGVDFGSDRRAPLSEWAVCAGLALRNLTPRERTREADHAERRLSA